MHLAQTVLLLSSSGLSLAAVLKPAAPVITAPPEVPFMFHLVERQAFNTSSTARPTGFPLAGPCFQRTFPNSEVASAWTSFRSATSSWVQQTWVQSEGHRVASSCAVEGSSGIAGAILTQIATDVEACVTGLEVMLGSITLGEAAATVTGIQTQGGIVTTTSTSTGGGGLGYKAKETGGAQVAAVAIAAAAGVMGLVGMA
ncbi:hypothetical protein QBC44DRAFT_384628 [Cladorrhinum sp. PSN332]|nr:hypothetical protein QBC44DRAFT_384628 [Cladorrhinum sp. PSN332]